MPFDLEEDEFLHNRYRELMNAIKDLNNEEIKYKLNSDEQKSLEILLEYVKSKLN